MQMSKLGAHATADALGLSKVTGFVNVLDVGYTNKSSSEAPRENGYEVSLELPLFDWGSARVARAGLLGSASGRDGKHLRAGHPLRRLLRHAGPGLWAKGCQPARRRRVCRARHGH